MQTMTEAAAPLYRWRFAGAEFDEARLELRVGGLSVEVEQKPLQVLAVLLRHAGEVVTKRELFDSVWAGRVTVDHVLATAVGKLRKALGEDGERVILTSPRVGYRLVAPVERVAVGKRHVSTLQLQPGDRVPLRAQFVLDTRLGAPGGSEVWRAHHAKTRESRVYKFSADGERLTALKREATLARLLRETLGPRPDFVHIIDWNFEQAPFFLECAFGGVNLLEWADGDPGLAAVAREQRLALFLRICDAVDAAHGVGVLHKDLKPANVLVDEGGQIRLTDFGSSRLLAPERLAELGITELDPTVTQTQGASSGSGTPLYLAPELLAGQAPTVKSDLYALGILLYQLLAGDLRKPMAPGWERDIDDALLCDDLRAATDGEPTHRLSGVPELSARVRTLEARRAAQRAAAREQASARAAKAALDRARMRRPWVVAAVIALAVGLSAALWQARVAEQARAEALLQARLAQEINRFLNEDLLGRGDHSTLAYHRNPSLRELLDAARERLDGRFSDQPRVEAELRATLAGGYQALGDYATAETLWRRVAELHGVTRPPRDETRLMAQYAHASALSRLSRFEEAQRLLDDADALTGARLEGQSELALQAWRMRATFHFQQFQWHEALVAYRRADALQRAVRPEDAGLAMHIQLSIGDALLRLGDAPAAETVARALLSGDPYSEASVGLARLATARTLLGRALRDQGRTEEAIAQLQRAALDHETSRGVDDQSTISTLSALGYAVSLQGDVARYVEIQRDVHQRAARRWGESNQYTLVERMNLGYAEMELGQAQAALQHFTAAADGLLSVAGPDAPTLHAARYGEGSALLALGRHAEVIDLIETIDAQRLARALNRSSGHGDLAALRGQALMGLGQREAGAAEIARALPILLADGRPEDELAPLRALLTASR